jgi:hypothetical protein
MTMVELNTATRAPGAPRLDAVPSISQRTIGQGVADVADAAKEVAAAQMDIWSLKGQRLGAIIGFGIVGMVLTIALVIYGFGLLDRALALALAGTTLPNWASPLIRGALYFGVPVAGMVACWHSLVGWGSAEDTENNASKGE